MKYLLILLLGFIMAQTMEVISFEIVAAMQRKCYPLWTQGKQQEYQTCMENEKAMTIAANITGFNFIYAGRQLLFGY
jgi:hypothetical protein